MIPIYIILAVAVLILLAGVGLYNAFVRLRNRSEEAWADIDVQLKRRYDLIPNLVETVKGYAAHEQSTFDAVTKARAAATQMTIDPTNVSADQMMQFSQMQDGLSQALGRLLAVSESYPDLKANVNFLELQKELTDTENKIQAARRFYNTNVRDLNTKVETFPANVIAGMFNFVKREYFELEENSVEKEPVKVGF